LRCTEPSSTQPEWKSKQPNEQQAERKREIAPGKG